MSQSTMTPSRLSKYPTSLKEHYLDSLQHDARMLFELAQKARSEGDTDRDTYFTMYAQFVLERPFLFGLDDQFTLSFPDPDALITHLGLTPGDLTYEQAPILWTPFGWDEDTNDTIDELTFCFGYWKNQCGTISRALFLADTQFDGYCESCIMGMTGSQSIDDMLAALYA